MTKPLLALFFLSVLFILHLNHAHAHAQEFPRVVLVDDINSALKKKKSNVILIGNGQKDQTVLYLGGNKGVLICFHGRGGAGASWLNNDEKKNYLNDFKNAGYSFVCPASLGEKWADSDIERVNQLLEKLRIDANQEIVIVGHSNGGTFASKYASTRNTRAVHLVNSRGLRDILKTPKWIYSTLFTYAKCDQKVDYKKIEKSYLSIKSTKQALVIDDIYKKKEEATCHKFINTGKFFLKFIKNNS